ncbi:hypothetical protein ACIP10_37155, partial [Streptomyces galbus]|uniref:hypothetical protein n=1 Tax=Streptomyces galbus TaxID=33898 RepID=UPI0037FCF44B
PHHHSPQQDDPQNTPEGDRQATPGNSPEHTPDNADRREEEWMKTVAALQAVIPDSPFHYLLAQVLDRRALQDPDTLAAAQQADAALQAGRGNTPPPELGERAEQILDQLTQRALTDRAQTALSTQTEQAFPPDPAQRRTTLLNAAARAADAKVIGWLPADLLWLYTEKGTQARQDLNITVTRAGIIRNFTTRKLAGAKIQPVIRGLRKEGTNWIAGDGAQLAMKFLRGVNGSFPYIVLGATKGISRNHRFKYEDPEALLGHLTHDGVLKALAPETHLVLTMWAENGISTDDARELAWNVADEHNRVVHYAAVNSRLSGRNTNPFFGLEMPNGESRTAEQLKDCWKQVTPQQVEKAGYGLTRELLGEAVRNDPALLARVRRSLARWTGDAATQTRSLNLDRLDQLVERMLPDHVQNAFPPATFPKEAGPRRQVLLGAVVEAVKEGASGWLPADLLWLYTEKGIEVRTEFNVTVNQVGIVRNFAPGKIGNMRRGIRGLNRTARHWFAGRKSGKADAEFLLGANKSLPYILHGPAVATTEKHRSQYKNPRELLTWLAKDVVLSALAPDAHLVLAMWADRDALRIEVRELAREMADKYHRVVDLSTVNARISNDHGGVWLGLEMPGDDVAWTEQDIRGKWIVEFPPGHEQLAPRLLTGLEQSPASAVDGSGASTGAVPARHGAEGSEHLITGDAMEIDSVGDGSESHSVGAISRIESVAAVGEIALFDVSLDHLLGQAVDESALSDDPVTMEAARQLHAALQAGRRNMPELALDEPALQILDQLTHRALPERVRPVFSTATGNGFPTGTAQRRTALLDAVAQAAVEGVIDWLPADLLWLYTSHGTRARQDLKITVTRAGIIRDFTNARSVGRKIRPFIRGLRKRAERWIASSDSELSMAFLTGTEKSLPYVLLSPTTATRADHRFKYEDPEALLAHLAGDCVLKALAPDAHLVLMMFTDNGTPTDDSRELAWNAAAELGRTVDFSTVNSRLSY